MLPRRRHEIGGPVGELKWCEFDDAVGPRSRGLPPAARADPVGRFVSGENVADAGDAAVCTADHGEPLEREGRPGTGSEEMFQTLKIARHVAVDECDPEGGPFQPAGGRPTLLGGLPETSWPWLARAVDAALAAASVAGQAGAQPPAVQANSSST